MKRTAIIAVWIVTLAVAYLGGYWNGRPDQVQPGSVPELTRPTDAQGPVVTAAADPSIRPLPVLDQAQRLVAADRYLEAIELIEGHLLVEAGAAEVLFLLSDLYQMTGQPDAGLEPLLMILRAPPDMDVAEQARRRVDLLVNTREQQLINIGDVAGLIRYFDDLVGAEPGFDGHRLKLTRWLIRGGELADAAQLLKQVGNVGVSDDELAAVKLELAIARTSLPIEQSEGSLYTQASILGVRSQSVRFLVDTGATMTGLSIVRLEEAGARKLEKLAEVQTANGATRMAVYQLSELRLGPLVLKDMEVLALRSLPANADGLLGMDVLNRLPKPVGRP